MIPSIQEIKSLWEKYQLPPRKRRHLELVAQVAKFLAAKCQALGVRCKVDYELLNAAALLHDIDSAVPKLPGERHPDAGVRILKAEGQEEIAELVKTHALHTILDQYSRPQTWEAKLLFLADKMVKDEIMTVDKRFALWRAEDLSGGEKQILAASYPRVKELEREILGIIKLKPEDISSLIREG